jgi:hypothetical protein
VITAIGRKTESAIVPLIVGVLLMSIVRGRWHRLQIVEFGAESGSGPDLQHRRELEC